jgi:hypothetical protein
MDVKVIIILTLLVSSLQAEVLPTLEDCSLRSEQFGGHNKMNPSCFDRVKESAVDQTHFASKENSFSAFVYKNLIASKESYEDGQEIVRFIGGEESMLHEIHEIYPSPNYKEISVLNTNKNGDREILTFKSNRNGNVRPRHYQHPLITDLRNILWNPIGDKILFYSPKHNKIFIIPYNANTQTIHKEELPSFINFPLRQRYDDLRPTLFTFYQNELVIYSHKSKLYCRFLLRENLAAEIKVFQLDADMDTPDKLEITKEGEVVLSNRLGEFLRFKGLMK